MAVLSLGACTSVEAVVDDFTGAFIDPMSVFDDGGASEMPVILGPQLEPGSYFVVADHRMPEPLGETFYVLPLSHQTHDPAFNKLQSYMHDRFLALGARRVFLRDQARFWMTFDVHPGYVTITGPGSEFGTLHTSPQHPNMGRDPHGVQSHASAYLEIRIHDQHRRDTAGNPLTVWHGYVARAGSQSLTYESQRCMLEAAISRFPGPGANQPVKVVRRSGPCA